MDNLNAFPITKNIWRNLSSLPSIVVAITLVVVQFPFSLLWFTTPRRKSSRTNSNGLLSSSQPPFRHVAGGSPHGPPTTNHNRGRVYEIQRSKKMFLKCYEDFQNLFGITPHPKIEIDLRVQRFAIAKFTQLFQYFSYEAPDLQDVFDSVGLDPKSEHIAADSDLVVHQLRWTGEATMIPNALDAAFVCCLTQLTLSNCEIALDDVHVILSECFAMDQMNIRRVSSSKTPILINYSDQKQCHIHGLESLTLSSTCNLDPLFIHVRFPRLRYLSLRLFEEGNETNFEALDISRLQVLRVRGNLPVDIEEDFFSKFHGSELDIGHFTM